jgi:8-oxo-dGTP diphosphatase
MEHGPLHSVAVTSLVRHTNGDILLVRTPLRGWELPGGLVEAGETLIAAAIREIEEESGVLAKINTLASVCSNIERNLVIFGFLADYVSGDLATSDETTDVKWVKPDFVLTMITHRPTFDRAYDLLNFENRIIYRAYTPEPYLVAEKRFI